jgi:uncharacterized protein with GYD domain
MLLVKKIEESPARVEAAKQTIRNLGGEVKLIFDRVSCK